MRKLCRACPRLANYVWRSRLWRFQTPLSSIPRKTIAAGGDNNQAPTWFLGHFQQVFPGGLRQGVALALSGLVLGLAASLGAGGLLVAGACNQRYLQLWRPAA